MHSPLSTQALAHLRAAAGPSPVRNMSSTPVMTAVGSASAMPAASVTGQTSTHLPQRTQALIMASTRPATAVSNGVCVMDASTLAPLLRGRAPRARALLRPTNVLSRHAPQRGAVDLVGGGKRKAVDYPDEARVLVGGRVGERETLDLRFVERPAGRGHHEGDRLLALDLVVDRHDRRLGDVGVAFQHALHVGRVDVL